MIMLAIDAVTLAALLVVHELGHALCARGHGLTYTVRLRLRPFRIAIAVELGTREQNRSIACAGPLASIVAGLALGCAGQTDLAIVAVVAYGLLMLVPHRLFDGYRILHPDRI